MRLILVILLLHSSNTLSQIGSSYLCVSTGHRLQNNIMDERELLLSINYYFHQRLNLDS